MVSKRFYILCAALATMLCASAIDYPTTSYEVDNGYLRKWTGPETDIDFTADPYLRDNVEEILENAFEGNENIRSIKFSSTLHYLSPCVFKDCPNLETVIFDADGVRNELVIVNSETFYNCPKLSSVTFSQYLTKITPEAFENCPSLTSFSIKNHPEWKSVNGVIYTKNQDKLILFPQGVTGHYDLNSNVVEIADYAFYQSHLSTIFLTNNLQCIGESAFEEAKQLTTVAFPNSLREIKRYAFNRCEALKSLMLPGSLETIGHYAFGNCKSLPETIKIPASVTFIDGVLCPRCPTVKHFEVNSENMFFSSRDGVLYNYDGDKLIEWPYGSIDNAVSIPEGITTIGRYAFYYAPLKEVNFPSSLKEVEEYAFSHSLLENVSLPEGTTKLCDRVFSFCDSLKTIELPSTLTEMGRNIFSRSDIYHNRSFACHMPMPVGDGKEIENNVSFLAADTLYVPEESIDFYSIAPGWRNFGTIKAIPIPKNYSVTFAQSQNGLIIVTSDGDEIESGTELREGSTITIRTFAFTDYELSSLTVNDVEVEDGADIIINGPTVIAAVFSTIAGIPSVQDSGVVTHNANDIYDLLGRKINISEKSLPKGFYIQGGTIIIVK